MLKPGGRLNEAYQEIATSIRRTVIAAMADAPDNPRQYLRPIAEHFLKGHQKVLTEARAEGLTNAVEALEHAIGVITAMFPDLQSKQVTTEEGVAA